MLNYENIKLENGKFLNRFYGKYNADVIFISGFELNKKSVRKIEKKFKKEITQKPLKFFNYNCCMWFLKGFFRINKNKTKIFEIDENGDCVFCGFSWGSSFWRQIIDIVSFILKTDGEMTVSYLKEKIKYYHSSSISNNSGNTYYIFSLDDWNNFDKQNYTEDDF